MHADRSVATTRRIPPPLSEDPRIQKNQDRRKQLEQRLSRTRDDLRRLEIAVETRERELADERTARLIANASAPLPSNDADETLQELCRQLLQRRDEVAAVESALAQHAQTEAADRRSAQRQLDAQFQELCAAVVGEMTPIARRLGELNNELITLRKRAGSSLRSTLPLPMLPEVISAWLNAQ